MSSLTAQVYSAGAPAGTAPFSDIFSAKRRRAVNEIGTFEFTIPATDRNADQLVAGREVRIELDGEGEIIRGFVGDQTLVIGANGERMRRVTGTSLAEELAWNSLYWGVWFDDDTATEAVAKVLALPGGWTQTITGSYDNVTNSFDGMSCWTGLLTLAKILGGYIREPSLTAREVELKNTHASSGLMMMNVNEVSPSPSPNVGLIESLTVDKRGRDIWNRIAPRGSADGDIIYDLSASNRTTPYTISSLTPLPPLAVSTGFTGGVRGTPFDFGVVGGFQGPLVIGRDRVLLAILHTISNTPSSPKYAGKVVSVYNTWAEVTAPARTIEAAYLLNPPLRERFGDTVEWDDPTSSEGYWVLLALSNVDFNSPFRASNSAIGTSTTPSVTVATSSADDLVIGIIMTHDDVDPGAGQPVYTPGAGETILYQNRDNTASGNKAIVVMKAGNGAGVTIGGTLDESLAWMAVAISIRGARVWYLQDATSVTNHGLRIKPLPVNELRLSRNTGFDTLQKAHNSLYDYAANYLNRSKDEVVLYKANVVNFPLAGWDVGDKVRLSFVGEAEDLSGAYSYLNVDTDLVIKAATDSYDASGSRTWDFDLVASLPVEESQILRALEKTSAMAAGLT